MIPTSWSYDSGTLLNMLRKVTNIFMKDSSPPDHDTKVINNQRHFVNKHVHKSFKRQTFFPS
jgi:hypothetical protein